MSRPASDRAWCSSSFLTFRYVVDPNLGWRDDLRPHWPDVTTTNQIAVSSSEAIDANLRQLVPTAGEDTGVGILLSGGIDSAILAAYLPQGTPAFTIRYNAPGAIDESLVARQYASDRGLDLTVVSVDWSDHERLAPGLMKSKGAPLHAVEVGLPKPALAAAKAGVGSLIVGNGADSTFGGMDKLLSKEWTFDEFVDRYTFIDPKNALTVPVSMVSEYEKYRSGESIDVPSFLKQTHGIGIVQSFDNALESAGVRPIAPYESLRLDGPLDIERVRRGEPKYLLQQLFSAHYPRIEPPRKIPFARPMDVWLADWAGPTHPDFAADLDLDSFDGEQRWLLWTLDTFLHQIDAGADL